MRRALAFVLGLFALASSAQAQALPVSYGTGLRTGLVHYYRMGEASGARVDLMGGTSWTATGAPGNAAGQSGNGAAVEIGKYLSINQTSLLPGSTFTLSFWYKASTYGDDGFNGGPILTSSTTLSGFDLYKTPGANSLTFTRYAGSASTTTTLPSLNNWHFVQVWSGDGAAHLRIDGGAVVTRAGANITVSSGTLVFSFSDTVGMTAVVDELMVHNRILTTAEQDDARRGGLGKFYPF